MEGGKLLHVRRVVWLINELCRADDISGNDRDCLIGASIIHDLWFKGVYSEANHTVNGHEGFVYEATLKFKDRPFLNQIVRLAESHSGRWCVRKDKSPPKSDHRTLLHYADYLVSRRDVRTPVTTIASWPEPVKSRAKYG